MSTNNYSILLSLALKGLESRQTDLEAGNDYLTDLLEVRNYGIIRIGFHSNIRSWINYKNKNKNSFFERQGEDEGFHFSFEKAGEVDVSPVPNEAGCEIHTIVTYDPETF